MNISWDKRIHRTEELSQRYPFAREILGFYGRLLSYQKGVYELLGARAGDILQGPASPKDFFDKELPLSASGEFLTLFPSLLSLVVDTGPSALADSARELKRESKHSWEKLLQSYWQKYRLAEEDSSDVALLFFPRAFLQPYAEFLARYSDIKGEGSVPSSTCAFCGGRPQVGCLRPEDNGLRRSLVCSLCSTEWAYRRLSCTVCGEEDHKRLSYYTTPEFSHIRLEACESCLRYIKSVDLSKEPAAVPLVDEMAAVPLDLWAHERGYKKQEMNLIGI